MSRTKRIFMIMLTVILAFAMSVPANANLVSSGKMASTIDSQLQSLLNDASANKRIPVDIWLYENETAEEREQINYSKIGLNKMLIESNDRRSLSVEKVNEYIVTERTTYAEERAKQYALLRKDYSKVQGLQETRQADTRLFYSQYAPMISAELTPAEIKLLARDNRVAAIYYSPVVTIEDEGDVSLPTIGADYARDNYGYTGVGIKIGMIESGLPDNTESYLSNVDIIYDDIPNKALKYTQHANMVAAIMVGNTTSTNDTYEGIVPDAKLYATCYSPEIDNDWRARIEWLLSQGVHVINMSARLIDELDGMYMQNERWIDHIAYDHCVHFVKSAGNTSAGVSSPGMAFNILTVGAINDQNDIDPSRHVLCDFSSYLEFPAQTIAGTVIYPTNKPDLVAPGENITTAAGTGTGTSFAAPHVTAVVAQLCQFSPSFMVMPAVIKAVLTASIPHSSIAYDSGYADMDDYDKCGAGVVNARAALETLFAYRIRGGSFVDNGADYHNMEYTFSAVANQRVRVSLTWLKRAYLHETVPHVICDPSEFRILDVDLCIYDPDGVLLGDWRAENSNMEIADFFAPKTGTYTIEVHLCETLVDEVRYGVAWWLGETIGSN